MAEKKVTKGKIFPLLLILFGIAFLVGAIFLWVNSNIMGENRDILGTIGSILVFLIGLGANLKGWLDLFKPKKENGQVIEIEGGDFVSGDKHIHLLTRMSPSALHQLPPLPADFIGRDNELTELRSFINNGILILELHGVGGIGKTVLGLKLAYDLMFRYPEAQIFIDLRGVNAEGQTPLTKLQIASHIIRSFFPEAHLPSNDEELLSLYRSILFDKKIVLFFDNALNADQVTPFILSSDNCLTLITSRQLFAIPGMKAINVDVLASKDAITLAKEISSRLNYQEANQIVEQCGYLPLAIRLAVNILNTRPDWTTIQLVNRLKNDQSRLGLVESTLEISYMLLENDQQLRFKQLGYYAIARRIYNAGAGIRFSLRDAEIIWSNAYIADASVSKNKIELGGFDNPIELPELFETFDEIEGWYFGNLRIVQEEKHGMLKYIIELPKSDYSDLMLGKFIQTGLISYDRYTSEYVLHDLVALYAKKLFMNDGLECILGIAKIAKHGKLMRKKTVLETVIPDWLVEAREKFD